MKGVLVTGSNGGIGTAIVDVLQEEGYYVIGTDLGRDVNSLSAYIECDLEQLVLDSSLRAGFTKDLQSLLDGRELAGLVNNAAILALSDTRTLELSDFCTTMNVNVIAAFALSQCLIELLNASSGSIVNIGSIHAKLTKQRFIDYATSKAALRGLTQALAVDCGAKVRVNMIEPAAIATPMLLEGFRNDPEAFEALKEYHPLGRIGQPREVANLVAFLISAKSSFMTGSIIEINGGIGVRLHDPA